jgi:hypothetical protein
MVNDMYAIYESYTQVRESGNLAGGVNLPGNINHTTTKNQLSTGVGPTFDQGITSGDLGQDNEEIKAPKEISKLIKSITACAHRGDYSGIVVDCMRLSKAAAALVKK